MLVTGNILIFHTKQILNIIYLSSHFQLLWTLRVCLYSTKIMIYHDIFMMLQTQVQQKWLLSCTSILSIQILMSKFGISKISIFGLQSGSEKNLIGRETLNFRFWTSPSSYHCMTSL